MFQFQYNKIKALHRYKTKPYTKYRTPAPCFKHMLQTVQTLTSLCCCRYCRFTEVLHKVMQIYSSLCYRTKMTLKEEERQEDHCKIFAGPFMSEYFSALGTNMVILDLIPWPMEHTFLSRTTISSLWFSAVGCVC